MTIFRDKKAVTLVEVIMATVLLVVVLLMFTNAFVTSKLIYYSAHNKTILSYDLQYAMEHIYSNVMRAMGDGDTVTTMAITNPAVGPGGGNSVSMNINISDPLTSGTYDDDINFKDSYQYRKNGKKLEFSIVSLSPARALAWQSLLSDKIGITDVKFVYNNNIVTISLTGEYRGEAVTYTSACYPRLSTF